MSAHDAGSSTPKKNKWAFIASAGTMLDAASLREVSASSTTAGRADDSQVSGSSDAPPPSPPRPRTAGLPLHCAFLVLDCVSLKDIALRAARVSRAWYKTAAMQYAETVRVRACMPDPDTEVSQASASAASSSSSSSSAAVAPSPLASRSPFHRSDVFVPRSQPSLALMLHSRLRFLLFGIRTQLHVDVPTVAKIAKQCPQLHSCELVLLSETLTLEVVFPPFLRSLTLALLFAEDPRGHCSWHRRSAAPIDAYVSRIITVVAGLRCLREFGVRLSDRLRMGMATPKPQWLAPLANPPAGCRGVQSIHSELFTMDEPLAEVLRSIRSLTHIAVSPDRTSVGIASLLSGPADTAQLPLKMVPTLASTIVNPDLIPYLLAVRGTLEDLSPRAWSVPALDFLFEFRALRSVRFVESVAAEVEVEALPQQRHGLQVKKAGPEVRNPPVESVVCVLELMPQLTDVTVSYAQLSESQLDRMLAALARLERFDVESTSVTSLASFSIHPHLAVTLTALSIKFPNAPRDQSTHLLALSNLTSLSIAGSFTEPLFAQMLVPFTTRYRGSPLHWLRKFVPRSPKEAIPPRVLDASEKQAAYESFDRRVRAGLVHAGELLNSFQLTGVMQFLGLREFSWASRTCRAWRAAGSLPSCWPVVRYGGVAEINPTALGAALGADDPDAMPELHPSRFLRLSSNAPQVRRTILPELPLWKAARCIELAIAAPYHSWQSMSAAEIAQLTSALEALAGMKRLESLSADFSHLFGSLALEPFFAAIGGQLRRGQFSSLPPSYLRGFGRMEELSLAWSTGSGVCPGIELRSMVSLRCLSLTGVAFADALAPAVCFLSTHHALRSLEVNFCGVMHWQPNNRDVRNPQAFIEKFVNALADPASGGPAQLEFIRIFISIENAKLSLQPLMMLPRLRALDVSSVQPLAVSLVDIELAAMQGANLSTLESLSLGLTVLSDSFGSLSLLTGLRVLRLTDMATAEEDHERDFGVRLPVGVLARWSRSMTRLEVLALDGVQAPSGEGELSSLAQLKSLRALSLCKQHLIGASDLAVLPRIPSLQELQLHCIANVGLQERTWLSRLSSASASASASSSSSPSDLVAHLRGCSSLRLLRWSPSEPVMRANEDYTSRRPGIRNRGCLGQIDRDQLCFVERARDREALRSIMRQRMEAQSAWFASTKLRSEMDPETVPSSPPEALLVQVRFGNTNSHYRYSWLQIATAAAVAASAKSLLRLKDEGFSPHTAAHILDPVDLAAADAALLEAECEEERAAAALVGLAGARV